MKKKFTYKSILRVAILIFIGFPISGYSALHTNSDFDSQEKSLNSDYKVVVIHAQKDGSPCGLIVDGNSSIVPSSISSEIQRSNNSSKLMEDQIRDLFVENDIPECNLNEFKRIETLVQVVDGGPVQVAFFGVTANVLVRIIPGAARGMGVLKNVGIKVVELFESTWAATKSVPLLHWGSAATGTGCIAGTAGVVAYNELRVAISSKREVGENFKSSSGGESFEISSSKGDLSEEDQRSLDIINTASEIQDHMVTAETVAIVGASIMSLSGGTRVFFAGLNAKISCGLGTYFLIIAQ